eukprot:UN01849
MDSDPLVPKEVSPTQQLIIYGVAGLVAIYMLVSVIVIFVEGKKYGHIGSYLSAIALILLIVAVVLTNMWMPQDFMEGKARMALIGLNVCLFLVATGMMIQSLQKTPCPHVNPCTLSGTPRETWFSTANLINLECFPPNTNATFMLMSANKTCPQQPDPHTLSGMF